MYEFWRYDIPTDVVRYFLKELNIPFDEKVSRRKRNSLYSQSYDEWSKIYVEKKDLVTWLKEEIDRKIRNYGQ